MRDMRSKGSMSSPVRIRNEEPHSYDDMINLPHPVSLRHPQMPLTDRAAQFSPFAALTGHDEAVRETARLTEEFAELDEDRKEQIDRRLRYLISREENRDRRFLETGSQFREADRRFLDTEGQLRETGSRLCEPEIEVTYFQPDLKKSGGAYVTVRGSVKKIDRYHGRVLLADGTALPMESIVSIEGELFGEMEDSDI